MARSSEFYPQRRGVRVSGTVRREWPIGMRRTKPMNLASAAAAAEKAHMQEIDATMDGVPADDIDRPDGFYRGGSILRKSQANYRGQARARPNVDTADGWLRGGNGEAHPFFDHTGSRPPRVTATRRIGPNQEEKS